MTLQWVKMTAGKLKLFLLTAGIICLAQSLPAQTKDKITLSKQKIEVRELFREIERQTGSTIVVRSNAVNDRTIVEIPSMSGTLSEILTKALAGTGKSWQIDGDYIIIGMQPEAPVAQYQPQSPPVIINRSELKQFVPGSKRGADSIVYQTIEADPFRFTSRDKTFYTPGRSNPNGEVVAPFTTAERWQRSKFALKTNLLYGAGTLTPNLRGEFGLSKRTTLEMGASYNGWNLNGTVENNKKLVHGLALAEFRYWLCERFYGHYFGIHAFGGFYNIGEHDIPLLFEKEYRYEGTVYGAGLSYGYMLPLSPRWGLEFNIGVGVAQFKYDKYGCDKCEDLEGTYNKTYLGPTRAGINLIYIIK